MAPTRMKLRVRRRDNTAGSVQQPEEEEERRRESSGRSSRRKNTSNASTTAAAAAAAAAATAAAAAAAASSSPPSASTSARAVLAAEEASPDSKCPICLDRFNNLAYLDRCLHRFCFPCIQEWSHNKAECPLCKQPFASILHSVRAEDDFKEYTLRPPPANSSVAATVAMVAAMASAARSDHQMRLMLRRHRVADGGEAATTRRRRRERGGRGGGGRRAAAAERAGVWEWYLDSPPLPLPPLPHHPAVSPMVAEDSEEGEDVGQQRVSGGADMAERGVIFEGLTGLTGAVAPVASNDRASRRLMSCLATRQRMQRLQREGGTVRRLRERETVAFRRALYRSGIRVRGVAGVSGNQGQQQRDITAESFRRTPSHLNRLRPWLRRELTVLYGAHGSLVDIVQRIIMARLARHGLEDTPTIEEELRPFLLARTDHFLHELVSFARSPLSLDNYDLQAVYEPPATTLELDGLSSSSDSSSVIAISEGEEEERVGAAHDDVIQTGSCLSLSAWDDETPGPSYSTAEPSCSLASLSFSPAPHEAASEERGEKREEDGEEECLIVGYKKPIAERTPELVQLSSDTEEDDKEKKEDSAANEKPAPLPYLPTIPPSTSSACREEEEPPKEKDAEAAVLGAHACLWSGSSARSRDSVCTLSPATPGEVELQQETESWTDRKQAGGEAVKEKRRKKRKRQGREQSCERVRKSGTLYNPNRSIYPAMMRRHSHSPSPFHTSAESGSPLPPSPPDSSWEFCCSPLTSSVSSPSLSSSSSSSPLLSSPLAQTPPPPSLSPGDRSGEHHGEKPGGKRKYKSRHLDSSDKDPSWKPGGSRRREKRKERGEKESKKRDRGRKRERARRDTHSGESSSRKRRDDRSPSVEIIYEGTIMSDAAQPPARKRRRKHRKPQHSSSPVIITLDSDSSHDDANHKINSSSSSPLSSQQTVDFSDLPPLPLVHSAGVGGPMDADIGDLPVDILDRGSDGSEMEPTSRSKAARRVGSDNSDLDVDVENVEESGSLLGCDDDDDDDKEPSSVMHGLIRKAESKSTAGEKKAPPTVDGGTEAGVRVPTSDSHLLASILNELEGISAPKCDLSSNFEPKYKPSFRDQCDGRQAETRLPSLGFPEEGRWCNDSRDQNQGFDLQTCRTAFPPPPPLQRLKEDREVPAFLKQPLPVQSFKRNTPPPLKHKDAGSPHMSPISPDTDTTGVNSPADTNTNISHVGSSFAAKDDQTIPPISTLKKHFTSALALRRDSASTSSAAAVDVHSSCNLETIEPSSAASSTAGIHSTSHKSPVDIHSSSSGSNADCLPHFDFNSFPASQLHSSRVNTKEIPSSGHKASSSSELHPMNSLSPVGFHSAKTGWSKERPAHTDSTSGGHRNKTISSNFCRVAPVDLNPSSSVSADDTPAGSDVFSGANSDTSSPVCVSPVDYRTQNPSSPVDSHSSRNAANREKLSERLSPSTVPPMTPRGRSSPKSAVDLYPEGLKVSSVVNHEERSPRGHLPPTDLHSRSPLPPVSFHSSSLVRTAIDGRLNHTALSSSPTEKTSLTSQGKCSSESEPIVESHSKLVHSTDSDSKPHNHFDPSSYPQFPVDSRSKHCLPIGSQHEPQPSVDSHSKNFQLHTDNHVTSSPESVENQWSSSVDAQSPIDEHSTNSVWNTHTHSAT
ncbi:uncharacterized protein LOC128384043 [Scomber scombrus]